MYIISGVVASMRNEICVDQIPILAFPLFLTQSASLWSGNFLRFCEWIQIKVWSRKQKRRRRRRRRSRNIWVNGKHFRSWMTRVMGDTGRCVAYFLSQVMKFVIMTALPFPHGHLFTTVYHVIQWVSTSNNRTHCWLQHTPNSEYSTN